MGTPSSYLTNPPLTTRERQIKKLLDACAVESNHREIIASMKPGEAREAYRSLLATVHIARAVFNNGVFAELTTYVTSGGNNT